MKIKIKKITANDLQDLGQVSAETTANVKRQLREKLLSAFDIYKSNVYYGILTETEEEREGVLEWYQDLCDLEENALKVVPEKIKRYIK